MKIIDSHLHFCPGYPHFDEIAIEAGHINNEEHLRECFQKYNIVGGWLYLMNALEPAVCPVWMATGFLYALARS